MKKFLEWLSSYGIFVIICLLLLNFVQQCSISRQGTKNNKAIQETTKRVDSVASSLKNGAYILPSDELELILEINGYQVSKRLLYDNNAIIRQITRPDDQLNKYDEKLDSLRKEYKKYGR